MDFDRMIISSMVREYRIGKRYSQRKLAKEAGISNATVSRIEDCLVDADRDTLIKIADVLDIPKPPLLAATSYKDYSAQTITKRQDNIDEQNSDKMPWDDNDDTGSPAQSEILSVAEQALIDIYRILPPDKQEQVLEYATLLKGSVAPTPSLTTLDGAKDKTAI